MSASLPAAVDEIHIAGLVVHTLPEATAGVGRQLAAIPGVRVEATSADGKLVVTMEAADADTIAGELVRWNGLDGVLAASLVYQHAEPADAMDDEVDLEDHA